MMDDELIARRLKLPAEPDVHPAGPRQMVGPDISEQPQQAQQPLAERPPLPAEQPESGAVSRDAVPWDRPESERWPSTDLQQLTLEDAPGLPVFEATEAELAPAGEEAASAASVDEVPDEPWFMQSQEEPWPGQERAEVAWDRPVEASESTDSVVADRPSWDRPAAEHSEDADSATEATQAMPEFEAVLARVAEQQDTVTADPYDASAPVVADVGEPSRPVWPGWETHAGPGQATDDQSAVVMAETDATPSLDAEEPFAVVPQMTHDDAAETEEAAAEIEQPTTSSPNPPAPYMETPAGPIPPDDLFDFPVAQSADNEAPASAEQVADTPAPAAADLEVGEVARPHSAAPDESAKWVLRIELAIEGNRLVPVEVAFRTPREDPQVEDTLSAEGPMARSDSESAAAADATTFSPPADIDAAPVTEPESYEELSITPPPDENADGTDMTTQSPITESVPSVERPIPAEAPFADEAPFFAEAPIPQDPPISWEASEEWSPRPFDPAAPAWPPAAQGPPMVQEAASWPPAVEQPWPGSEQSPDATDAPTHGPDWPVEERLADPHARLEPIADPLADIPAPPPVNPDEPAARSVANTLRPEWRGDHKPGPGAGDSTAAEAAHESSSIMTAGVTLGIGVVVLFLLVVFLQLFTSLLP